MRLSLCVNGVLRTTASIPNPGYLSAHLNLSDRPKEKLASAEISLRGHDTSKEIETVSYRWPEIQLNVGDRVELTVLSDGPGDEPSEISRSSEGPDNLFLNKELATDVLNAVQRFDSELMKLYEQSEKIESDEEQKKFEKALAAVVYETGARLLYPIFRRHPELVPDELKGELL